MNRAQNTLAIGRDTELLYIPKGVGEGELTSHGRLQFTGYVKTYWTNFHHDGKPLCLWLC